MTRKIQGLATTATDANIRRTLQFYADGTAHLTSLFGVGEGEIIQYVSETIPVNGKPYVNKVSLWDERKVKNPKEAIKAVKAAFDGFTEWGEEGAFDAVMLPIWDKYNLWATLVIVKREPKRKGGRKSDSQIVRVGSTFAGAVSNSKAVIDDGKEKTTGANLSFEAKRVLLELVRYAPKQETTKQLELFDAMEMDDGSPGLVFDKVELKKVATNIFGHGGTKEIWRVVNAMKEAMNEVVTAARVVDVQESKTKKGETRRVVTYKELFGRFIEVKDITRKKVEQEGMTIETDIESVKVVFNQVFNYWAKHYYQAIDVPYLLERSREKNGEEYFAMRLWAIDLTPCIKAATKEGKKYEATFRFEKLPGYSERNRDDRQKVRQRCEAIANEICQELGAESWEIVQERGNGGLRNVGIKFVWRPKKKKDDDSAE